MELLTFLAIEILVLFAVLFVLVMFSFFWPESFESKESSKEDLKKIKAQIE
jgi:hypothetical protein